MEAVEFFWKIVRRPKSNSRKRTRFLGKGKHTILEGSCRSLSYITNTGWAS